MDHLQKILKGYNVKMWLFFFAWFPLFTYATSGMPLLKHVLLVVSVVCLLVSNMYRVQWNHLKILLAKQAAP